VPVQQTICAPLAMSAGVEMQMKIALEPKESGMRITGLATLLALVSAISVAGCHSHAAASQPAMITSTTPPPVPTVGANPLAGLSPSPPYDETLITPTETVGAARVD
jgi:hypothetical protein